MIKQCIGTLCSLALTNKWLHVQQDAEAMNFAWVLKKNADNPRRRTLWRYFWINLFSLDMRLSIAVCLQKLSKCKTASKWTEIPTAVIKPDWSFPKINCLQKKKKTKKTQAELQTKKVFVVHLRNIKPWYNVKRHTRIKSLIPAMLCRRKYIFSKHYGKLQRGFAPIYSSYSVAASLDSRESDSLTDAESRDSAIPRGRGGGPACATLKKPCLYLELQRTVRQNKPTWEQLPSLKLFSLFSLQDSEPVYKTHPYLH